MINRFPSLNDSDPFGYENVTDRAALDLLVFELRDDQCARWRAGERARAEYYLLEFPSLTTCPEDAVVLINGEIQLRLEIGEQPSLEEYQQRFPQFAKQLSQLFEMEEALSELTAPADMSNRQQSEPPVVPGYELLEEVGRGGMGIVYKARDVKLNRQVALKLVSHTAQSIAEARVVAQLQHQNIVQIYECSELQGFLYFSLEFCAGGSLDRQRRTQLRSPREVAHLVEVLARAIQVAHDAGVIHGDMKPANVLLTADGIPKICDFGLAKNLVDANPTRMGLPLGTPPYMAPEQAEGKDIGVWTDVYGLGATLYELLTGRPPFLGFTREETLRKVLSTDPMPVRGIQSGVPADIETICLKCLRKDPTRRYASAVELADDLRRFQEHRPIAARPAGHWERSWKWVRRNPAMAAMSFALFAAFLGVGFGLGFGWVKAEQTRETVRKNRVLLWNSQGSLLLAKNDVRGAQHAYRQALAIDVNDSKSWSNLANALYRDNDPVAALEACYKAVTIDANNADGWHRIGVLKAEQNDLTAAVDAYRKALASDPKNAKTWNNLGVALRYQLNFAEAVKAYRQALALDPIYDRAHKNLTNAERLLELETRLPNIMQGDSASVTDLLDLAALCFDRKRYLDATELYRKAFATEPSSAQDLTKGRRFAAAKAAALAGTGKGHDAETLNNEELSLLRKQALAWLRTDLLDWTRLFEEKEVDSVSVARVLTDWQREESLIGIRDKTAPHSLSLEDIEDVEKLWRDVAELQKKADAKLP